LAKQVNSVETELTPNNTQLFDEQGHGPKLWVVWVIGVAGTQLVVENYLTTLASGFFKRFQIVMRAARTAMQTEQGQPVRTLLLADDPVPNPEIAK
jgi:hypothetical protein